MNPDHNPHVSPHKGSQPGNIRRILRRISVVFTFVVAGMLGAAIASASSNEGSGNQREGFSPPPVTVSDGTEVSPLGDAQGDTILDDNGRVVLIDPDRADEVLKDVLADSRYAGAVEKRMTEDGLEEDFVEREPVLYADLLDELNEGGAVHLMDPKAEAFDSFCAEMANTLCDAR